MNLIIECGNTSQKLALFNGTEMEKFRAFRSLTPDQVKRFCAGHDIGQAILSSVIKTPLPLLKMLRKHYSLLEFDEHTDLPLLNAYATPATLGRDRLACAVAAASMFPGRPVLAVDAGTCIKYDFITAQGEYLGGAISPGIRMRLLGMHAFTAKLPLVRAEGNAALTGRDTRGSILSGAVNGALAEVDGIIGRYRREYKGIQVVLTGGDLPYFEDTLKNRIFAVPHLVLKGLNIILNHNAAS